MGDMSKQQRTAGSIQAMIGQEPFQSLNIRGQAFGRGGLPTLIPQCPAHHVTRRTTDCPGADRVSQAFSQFRRWSAILIGGGTPSPPWAAQIATSRSAYNSARAVASALDSEVAQAGE